MVWWDETINPDRATTDPWGASNYQDAFSFLVPEQFGGDTRTGRAPVDLSTDPWGAGNVQQAYGTYAPASPSQITDNRDDRSGVWDSPEWKAAVDSLGTGPADGYVLPGVGSPTQGPMSSEYADALRRLAGGGGGASAPSLGGIRNKIETEYNALLGRLDEMYQLAETEQERAMIEFALDDLSDQYRSAQESIGMVFDAADEQVGMYADRATDRAAGVGDMVRDEYDAGVERQMRQEAQARALLGDQFGNAFRSSVQGSPDRTALDAALMENAGAREGAYQQDMADMSAEDARWLEAQQGTLRSANTAEASRINAALRAEAIRQHEAQVAARVNAERMARAQAEQQLVQQKLAQQAQLAQQEASMRAAASRANASARQSALQQLAQMEAEGGGRPIAFGDLTLDPVNGRVGPAAASGGGWDVGTLGTIMHGYQSAVAASPADYFSERQRALDALLARAPVAEGEQLNLYEGWLNDAFDQVTPDAYRDYIAATGSVGGGPTNEYG